MICGGAFESLILSHTQPNKTYKCSTQELTQGHLTMTIIFNQSFLDYNGKKMDVVSYKMKTS